MTYEFTFNFRDDDPLYLTHETNTIDNELLQFLIDIDIDFSNITHFTVEKL